MENLNFNLINMSNSSKSLIKQELESAFESLSPFPPQTNYVPLIKDIYTGLKLIGSTDSFISSLTLLRRINKYENKLFMLLFGTFFPYFQEKFKNENNSIIIHLLTLVYEMCSHFTSIEFYYDYLPFIVKKVIKMLIKYEQQDVQIINISKEIMKVIFLNFIPHDVFDILISLLKNKNKNVMLKAAEYSFEFFNSLDKTTLKDDLHWGDMFTVLSDFILHDNEDIAKTFYQGVKAFFSQNEWEDILCQATLKELSILIYIERIDIKKIENRKEELGLI